MSSAVKRGCRPLGLALRRSSQTVRALSVTSWGCGDVAQGPWALTGTRENTVLEGVRELGSYARGIEGRLAAVEGCMLWSQERWVPYSKSRREWRVGSKRGEGEVDFA